jgi:hypothetical protein
MVSPEITSMNRRSRLPLPRALKMPLRDILRGVTTVADLTEEVLEPATALLPSPVQSTFKSALATFEGAGASAVTPRVDQDDIARASAFLFGSDTSRQALETFVNVLAYAWEHMQAGNDDRHLLLSETVAAASLAVTARGDAKTAHARAATLLMALRKTNAASRLPGIPMTGPMTSEEERVYIDQILLAATAWLLSDRALGLAEEERLLELSMALVQALGEEVLEGFADQTSLAEQLKSLADHL